MSQTHAVRSEGPNVSNLVRGGGQVLGGIIPPSAPLGQVLGSPILGQGQPQNDLLRDGGQNLISLNLIRGQVPISLFPHLGANQVLIGFIPGQVPCIDLMSNQGFVQSPF